MAGFAVVGVILLNFSSAASTFITAQPETSALSGNQQVGSEPITGTSYVQFGMVNPSAVKCLLFLHGKSGDANQSSDTGNWTTVAPRGNATGWGGWQWLYFPDSGYQEVRTILSNAVANSNCGQIIVHGFSNGAAAAGKLYCKDETFGGKVIGYIIDDPVADHSVEGCLRPAGVKVVIYWTGGLDGMPAGSDCAAADWTCEGGSIIGIDAYSQFVGVSRKQSIYTSHQPYGNPPELFQWW